MGFAIFKPKPIFRGLIGSTVAIGLAMSVATLPSPARADGGDIAKIAVGVLILCGVTGGCKGKKAKAAGGKGKGGGKKAGPVDAGNMDKDEKMLIQQALARLGFYTGGIDGSFGNGTRTAIRAYQASIGAAQTGVLDGAQVNALMAASPKFAFYAPDDPMLFEADIAPDLSDAEIKEMQARLNAMGYDAGPVDGDMGGRTRTAIAAYKASLGLRGDPLPTKRLLAVMVGAPVGVGAVVVAAKADGSPLTPPLVPGAPDPAKAPDYQESLTTIVTAPTVPETPPVAAVAPGSVVNFELAGLRVGMTETDIADVMAENLEGEVIVKTGAAADFGGDALLSMGQLLTQPSWPTAPAEQVVAFYDETVPELGALAIVRTVLLPPSVTQETFETEMLSKMIETYGRDGMVEGTLTWVGDESARQAAAISPTALAGCGAIDLGSIDVTSPGADVGWGVGGAGVALDTGTLGTVTAKCGDVLKVAFQPGMLRFALWNTDLILQRRAAIGGAGVAEAVPAIKF